MPYEKKIVSKDENESDEKAAKWTLVQAPSPHE
jgi:hypothetical protein